MDSLVVVMVSTEKQIYMRISTMHYHILAIQDFIPKQQLSFGSSCRYYRDYSKTGLNPLLLHIIRRIMEIQSAVFRLVNGNQCL